MINIPIPLQQTLSYFVFASVLTRGLYTSHPISSLYLVPYIASQPSQMFGKGRYFGLRGQALNLAVGIIAGIDFL